MVFEKNRPFIKVDVTEEVSTRLESVDEQLAEGEAFRFDLYPQTNNVKFVAHRGASQVAPENSIPAYQIAGKAGFWGAECDAIPTSDGVWVLMHDTTIDRTTDGTGNVNDLTLDQIKTLNIDAGSNIASYPRLKVPTLEEYLITCKNYNLVPYIELKGVYSSSNYADFVALLRKYGFETKSIVISGSMTVLREIRFNTPLTHLQYVTNAIYPTTISDTVDLGNSSITLEYTIATQSLIDELHGNGLKVGVWTLNNYEIAKSMIELGVDFITSDNIVNVRWE